MAYLLIYFLIFILPIFVAGRIAKKKNRSEGKGQFVGLVLGWIGVIGLWLALKTRDPNTRVLY